MDRDTVTIEQIEDMTPEEILDLFAEKKQAPKQRMPAKVIAANAVLYLFCTALAAIALSPVAVVVHWAWVGFPSLVTGPEHTTGVIFTGLYAGVGFVALLTHCAKVADWHKESK